MTSLTKCTFPHYLTSIANQISYPLVNFTISLRSNLSFTKQLYVSTHFLWVLSEYFWDLKTKLVLSWCSWNIVTWSDRNSSAKVPSYLNFRPLHRHNISFYGFKSSKVFISWLPWLFKPLFWFLERSVSSKFPILFFFPFWFWEKSDHI